MGHAGHRTEIYPKTATMTSPLTPPAPQHRLKALKPFIPWLLLLAAGIGWGGSISLTKLAAESGYHPMTLVFWQLLMTVVILGTRQISLRIAVPVSRNHLLFYIVAGALGTALPDFLAYFIAPNLPAGIISIVYALVPMMTFALAIVVRSETFDLRRFAGVILGLAAILILVAPDLGEQPTGKAIWIFLLVLTGFSYAVETVFATFYMPKSDHPLTLLTGMSTAALIMVTPVMLVTDIPFTVQNILGTGEKALITSTIIHIVAYAALLYLIRHTGAIFSSQIAYVVTLSGVFWGIIIFTESHNIWTWISLTIAIAGLALVRARDESTNND